MAPHHDPSSRPSSSDPATALVRALDRRLSGVMAQGPQDPFFADATLYGIEVRDPAGLAAGDEAAFRHCFIATTPYVYDLLEGASAALARLYDAAAVVTTGWSAPGEGPRGLPPRLHPDRRRVRLLVVVDDTGLASALRFADTPDEVAITTAGRGPLGDAMAEVWSGGAKSRSLTM